MADLDGSNTRADLGGSVTMQAPGLRGSIERLDVTRTPGARAPAPEVHDRSLTEALTDTGFETAHAFSVDLRPVPGATGAVRGPGGAEGLVVNLPAPGAGAAQVAMLADSNGVVTWHFPEPSKAEAGRERFVVPVRPEPPGAGPAGQRGVVGLFAHKLLSVLVYKLADAAIGLAANALAGWWEGHSHPYGVRTFDAQNRQTPGVGTLTADDWTRLGGGRSLLFLHGTFSSSTGGFGALPPATLDALHQRYDRRVFAFDHPTMSTTPQDNVARLASLTPPGNRYPVDVVSHSRGGLVARALAGAGAAGRAPYDVKRIVFVATPNAGTDLAIPERVPSLINRYTTLLNVLPDGPWSVVTDVLSGVLTAVKVVGQGAIGGLHGLDAMNPANTTLPTLGDGTAGAVELFGISADWEPPPGLRLLSRIADAAVDDVFRQRANDCVVPSDGVCDPGAGDGFPVAEASRFSYGTTQGVWHCNYFGRPEVSERLLTWLTGPA